MYKSFFSKLRIGTHVSTIIYDHNIAISKLKVNGYITNYGVLS